MAERFHYGGQAVIEGVMIRGQKTVVTAVRRHDGEMAVDIQLLPSLFTGKMRKIPVVRGVIALIEAMVLGIKTLLYSANMSVEKEEEKVSGGVVWASMAGSLAFAVALFFIAPLFLARLLDPYIQSSIVFHLIEGFIRLGFFIAYLKSLALVSDIRRVFAYHGAEHKAVNAYEGGVSLEVEAIRQYSTAHVRCGTSFLFAVLIIAIVIFAIIGRPSVWVMIVSRIALVPLIAALGYEATHFGARHLKSKLVRAFLAPGLWLQRLTTREPDDNQLEVALSALKKVVEIDGSEEAVQASS
jgi:uncharacterized protein YqhQ